MTSYHLCRTHLNVCPLAKVKVDARILSEMKIGETLTPYIMLTLIENSKGQIIQENFLLYTGCMDLSGSASWACSTSF